MAIPWLVVLQSVPWTDVIRNAPKVAEAAKKLFGSVDRAPAKPKVPAAATLDARVAALEGAVADLHAQMLASSELIKTLAEQNTELVARVELNRARLRWLSAGFAVAVAAAVAAALVFAR